MERFEAFDENGKKIIFELVETFGMYDKDGNINLEGIDDDELSDAIEIYEELKSEKEKI